MLCAAQAGIREEQGPAQRWDQWQHESEQNDEASLPSGRQDHREQLDLHYWRYMH